MKPARCPSSWRMVVRRSYFPWASESAVARSAVSVRVCENSLWSKGVVSMNQPSPFALWSMRIFPPLGIPWSVNSVTWASASCPVGRSVTWRVRLSGLSLNVLVNEEG